MAKNDNLYKSTAQDVAEAPKQTPATPTQPTSNVTNAQRADGAIDMNAVQAGASVGRQKGVGAKPISEQVQAGSPQDNRTHQPAPQETAEPTKQGDANESFVRNNVDNVQFTQAQQPQEQQTPLQQSYNTYTQQHQITSDQRQAIRYRDDAKRLEDQSKGKYLNTRNGFLAKRAGDFLKQYEKQGQTIDDGMKRQAVEEAIKATGGKIADDDDWANTINDIVGRVNSQYTFSNRAAKTLQQLPTADDMMAWYEQGKLGNTHINLIKDANPQLYNEFMQKKQAHDKAQEMASYATDLHETYRDLDESVVDDKGKQIKYQKKTLDNPLEQMEQSIITYLNQEGGLATEANLKTMSQITDTDEIRRLTKEVNELTNRYEEIEDKKFDMLDDIRNKQGIDAFDARIIMADQMRALTREQTLIQRQHRLIAGDLQALKDEAIESYQLQMQQLDRNERMRSQKLGEMFQVYGLLQNKQQRKDAQKAQQAELEMKQQQLQREEQRWQIDREDKLFYYQSDQAFKVAQIQSQRERDLKINQLARSQKREDTYLQHELEIEKYGIKSKLDLQTKKELLQWEYDHPGQQMYSDGDGNYMFYDKNTGEIGKIGNVLDHVSDVRTAGESNAGYTSGGASYKTPTGNWEYKYNPQSGEFAAIRNGKVTTGSYLDTIGRKTMMAGGKATNIVGKKNKNGRREMYSHWKVGIDVDGSSGDPIPTAVSGTVTIGNDPNGFGKHVKVKTDDGYTVYYSHLSGHNLKNGDRVNAGDLVGLMGNTGGVYGSNGKRPGPNDKETGSHLDISIRKPNGSWMEVNEAMAFVNNRAKTAHQSGWNSEQSVQTRAAQSVIEEMEFDDAKTNNVRSWSKQKQARYSAYVSQKKQLSQQQAQAESAMKQNDRVMHYANQISHKSPQVKEYIAASNMFSRVEAAYYGEHTAASDMAMVFAFMKVLDPGSVVREGEQAQAQNAAGVPDRVRNLYNNAISGQRLSAKQRTEFYQQAQGLVSNLEKKTEGSLALYKQSMEAEGIDPDLVFNTFRTTEGYNNTGYQSVMQTPSGGYRKAVGNGVYAEVDHDGEMYLVRGSTKQKASLLDLQSVGMSAAQLFDMTQKEKVSEAQTSVLDRLGY